MSRKYILSLYILCCMSFANDGGLIAAASTIQGDTDIRQSNPSRLFDYFTECTGQNKLPAEFVANQEAGFYWFQETLGFDLEKDIRKQALLAFANMRKSKHLTEDANTKKELFRIILNYEAEKMLMKTGVIDKNAISALISKRFSQNPEYVLFLDLKEDFFSKKLKPEYLKVTQLKNWMKSLELLSKKNDTENKLNDEDGSSPKIKNTETFKLLDSENLKSLGDQTEELMDSLKFKDWVTQTVQTHFDPIEEVLPAQSRENSVRDCVQGVVNNYFDKIDGSPAKTYASANEELLNQDRLDQLQSELDSLQTELGTKNGRIVDLEAEIKLVKEAATEKDNAYKNLEAHLRSLTEEKDDLGQRIAEKEAAVQNLTQQLTDAQETNRNLGEEIQESLQLQDESSSAHKGRVEQLENHITELQSQLEAATKSLEVLQKEHASLEAQLKEETVEKRNAIREKTEAASKTSQIETQLVDVKSEKLALEKKVRESEKQISDLKKELATSQEELAQANSEHATALFAKEAAHAQAIDALKAEHETALIEKETALKSAQESLKDTVAERDTHAENIVCLTKDLDGSKEVANRLQTQIEGLKAAQSGNEETVATQISEIQAKLSGEEARVTSIQNNLVTATAELAEKETAIKDLAAQVESLTIEKADLNTKFEALKVEHANAVEAHKITTETNSALQKTLDALTAKEAELNDEHTQAVDALKTSHDNALKAKEAEVVSITGAKTALELTMADLKTNLKQETEKNEKLTTEIDNLRAQSGGTDAVNNRIQELTNEVSVSNQKVFEFEKKIHSTNEEVNRLTTKLSEKTLAEKAARDEVTKATADLAAERSARDQAIADAVAQARLEETQRAAADLLTLQNERNSAIEAAKSAAAEAANQDAAETINLLTERLDQANRDRDDANRRVAEAQAQVTQAQTEPQGGDVSTLRAENEALKNKIAEIKRQHIEANRRK